MVRIKGGVELRKRPSSEGGGKLADGMTAKMNFNIFYEIDGEELGSVLRVDEYGGDEHFSWVMLEPVGGGGSSPAAETKSPAAGEA